MNPYNIYKVFFTLVLLTFNSYVAEAQENVLDLKVLKGTWKLDLTPENKEDTNYAVMKIDRIENNLVEGEFYREGVAIQEGRTNTQSGRIYVALISGDNSGIYNSAFYYENGKIYGTTHSINRDFLAVWEGEKQ